jgi:hypothetical protein
MRVYGRPVCIKLLYIRIQVDDGTSNQFCLLSKQMHCVFFSHDTAVPDGCAILVAPSMKMHICSNLEVQPFNQMNLIFQPTDHGSIA